MTALEININLHSICNAIHFKVQQKFMAIVRPFLFAPCVQLPVEDHDKVCSMGTFLLQNHRRHV